MTELLYAGNVTWENPPPRRGVYRVVGKCRVCEVPLVSNWAWRQGHRPEGHQAHRGGELCPKHHERIIRHGTVEPPPPARPPARGHAQRKAEETLTDWVRLRTHVASLAEAARRMNMSHSALDKALYRARLRGDHRGDIPDSIRRR